MDQDSINEESIKDSDNASEGDRLVVEAGYQEIAPFLNRPGSTYMLSNRLIDSYETMAVKELETTDRLWSAVMQDIAGYAHTQKTGTYSVVASEDSLKIKEGARKEFHNSETPRLSERGLFRVPFLRSKGLALLGALALAVVAIPLYKYKDRNASILSSSTAPMKVVSTTAGQRVTYHFPDGSSVLLSPGTTVQYSSDFGVSNRDVILNGEALFTITQQSGSPFVVKTGEGDVRVLGTTFSVRHFEADKAATVIVAEGKISVASEVLISGNSAVINKGGVFQINRSADISAALSWTTGRLEFKRAPFKDVVSELERWLGLTIDVDDKSILEQRLTGSFLLSEPDAALENIASLLNLRVKRVENHVSFTINGL